MFKKKLLATAVIGFGALSLSTVAMADGDAIGTNYASPVSAPSAVASTSGVYVGAQAGWASVDYGSGSSNNETGFTARPYAGYQFNPYVSVETGYSFLPTMTNNVPGVYSSSQLQAWDLLGKLSLPLSQVSPSFSNTSVYAKVGGVYEWATGKFAANGVQTSVSESGLAPAAGVGASYNLTNNVAANVDYMHFFDSNTNSDINNLSADMVTLGVSYLFGN